MLVELSLAVVILLFISLWAFQTNMQTIRPRNWAMVQGLTDAYMTGPLAQAEAVDFNDLVSPTSDWPTYPSVNLTSPVLIGAIPEPPASGTGFQSRPISGTLVQTKRPDPNNLPAAGGTGTLATNPARVESWLVESHLTYTIGSRQYVKSRTTVRTR